MNKFSKYISSQFKNPRGIGGVIISIIQNVINKAMYKRAVSLINLQSNEALKLSILELAPLISTTVVPEWELYWCPALIFSVDIPKIDFWAMLKLPS